METMNQFFIDLLEMMGLKPTPWRLAVLAKWATFESPYDHSNNTLLYNKAYNPLATTWLDDSVQLSNANIGFGSGNWNSVPVRMYATHKDGVVATYKTIMLDYYSMIRKCLSDQTAYYPSIKEFKTWIGSDGYAQEVFAFMYSTNASRSEEVKKIGPVEELNDALQKRFAILQYAANLQARAYGSYDDVVSLYEQLKKFF